MRAYLKTKLALHHKYRRVIVIGVLLFALFTSIDANNHWDSTLFGIVLFLAFDQALIAFDRGYRLSYDDARIYMRPNGLRWNLRFYPESSLAYDDIEVIEGNMGRDPGGYKRHFMPFEEVRIYGKVDKSGYDGLGVEAWDYLPVIPDQLDRVEGMNFLHDLYDAYSDKFDPDLAEFMESGKSWS